jgi:hypothetical protein
MVDRVVSGTGTIGVRFTDPEIEVVEDGGGCVSPLLIAVLLLLGGIEVARRRRGVKPT